MVTLITLTIFTLTLYIILDKDKPQHTFDMFKSGIHKITSTVVIYIALFISCMIYYLRY